MKIKKQFNLSLGNNYRIRQKSFESPANLICAISSGVAKYGGRIPSSANAFICSSKGRATW